MKPCVGDPVGPEFFNSVVRLKINNFFGSGSGSESGLFTYPVINKYTIRLLTMDGH
jgi:hypothetical protein